MDEVFRPPLTYLRDYAELGLAVMPACPPDHIKQYPDCKKPGKVPYDPVQRRHMKGWPERTIPTQQEIDTWCDGADTDRANIVCTLGWNPVFECELVAVDVDGERGRLLFAQVTKGNVPSTWAYKTGRGMRYVYAMPSGFRVRLDPGPGIEFKSKRNSIVLPPSVHENGSRYEWLPGLAPWEFGPPAQAPAEWMVEPNDEGKQGTCIKRDPVEGEGKQGTCIKRDPIEGEGKQDTCIIAAAKTEVAATITDFEVEGKQGTCIGKQDTWRETGALLTLSVREVPKEVFSLTDTYLGTARDRLISVEELRGVKLRQVFTRRDVAEACIKAMGIHARIGEAFRCILPGHGPDNDASASVAQSKTDDIYRYVDWHCKTESERSKHGHLVPRYLLGDIYASLHYGQIVEPSALESAVWHRRLLVDSGLLEPAGVDSPTLPKDARPALQTVYKAFLRLVAIRWLFEYGEPVMFSWRFAVAWCSDIRGTRAISQSHCGKAMQELLAKGFVHKTGEHKRAALFLPGTPELVEKRRLAKVSCDEE